ncbi:MAG: TonB-dependent receptor [Erythrobacter sp.]
MKIRYLLAASVVSLAATSMISAPVAAQETTSSVRGTVTDADGNPIPGAEVTVTHQPSGTRSELTTDAGGNFNASGLRLGGPFIVTVTAPGYEPTEEEIGFLSAGQAQRVGIAMAELGQEIVVSGSRQRSAISLATGAATVLTARDVFGVANVDRTIQNLAQRDPLVTVAPNRQGIQIAGQNNRFNRFTVDGVDFSDPFGLEAGGLVSNRGPVPLDAIGEFSVEVAPVDIQQGNFLGGAINTQLKSGGNDFTFLGAAFYQDSGLRGTRSRDFTRTGAFESQIFTGQVTGPIIKDKLFFAVTYERTRDTVPAAVQPSQLGITDAQINEITGIANGVYGFDPLGVANDITEKDDKLIAKIDWNVAPGHRVSATYMYNEGSLLAGQTGAGAINAINPTFSLLSNNYTQGATNHFGIIQSNNQWSDSFATMLRVSYADYTRLQVPIGGNTDFGEFQICLDPVATIPTQQCTPGTSRLQFGPDISRQANELDSQRLSVEFAATLKLNNHTVKVIAERRRQDVRNLFAQRVSGAWTFDGVDDFQNQRAAQLDFAVPLRGGIDTVTAEFQNNSWTFGIMDTIDVTDNLTVVAGMRYDLYDTPDRPFFNEDFLTRFGFPNTANLNGRDLFQPRFAVNWRPTDRLTMRGSAGIFGGGNPLVWISNNYSNPGPTLGRAQVRRRDDGTFQVTVPGLTAAQQNAIGAETLNNVTGGTGVPASLINAIRGVGTGLAGTNSLDPNFRPQSQWRFSGSADYRADLGALGDDWNFGVDVIYSKVRDALEWTDLRAQPIGTLPDGRIRHAGILGNADGNTDIFLTNVGEGDSWNLVARFNKRWMSGFYLNGAYTYQEVTDRNPGTSSVAFSNYVNAAAGVDPNFSAFGTSNYQTDHQFRLTAGFDGEIFGDNLTRVELFYIARAGQRFSYTFNQLNVQGRSLFGTTGRSDRNLMYVPNVSSPTADPRVVYAPGFDFAGFQNFIQNSELAGFQGEIAPKNIGESPWWHNVDISIRQQVPFFRGGKIELFADMENVLNFIDKELGNFRQVGFPFYAPLVNVSCADAACNQYQFANRTGAGFQDPVFVTQPLSSLWGVRFGIRVAF